MLAGCPDQPGRGSCSNSVATDAPVKPALSNDSRGDVIKVLFCVLSLQSFEWLNPRAISALFATV